MLQVLSREKGSISEWANVKRKELNEKKEAGARISRNVQPRYKVYIFFEGLFLRFLIL